MPSSSRVRRLHRQNRHREAVDAHHRTKRSTTKCSNGQEKSRLRGRPQSKTPVFTATLRQRVQTVNKGKTAARRTCSRQTGVVEHQIAEGRRRRFKDMYVRRLKNGMLMRLVHTHYTGTTERGRVLCQMQLRSVVERAVYYKQKLFLLINKRMKKLTAVHNSLLRRLQNHTPLQQQNFLSVFGGKWLHTNNSEAYYAEDTYDLPSVPVFNVDSTGLCRESLGEKVRLHYRQVKNNSGVDHVELMQDLNRHPPKRLALEWDCKSFCNIRTHTFPLLETFLRSFVTLTPKRKLQKLNSLDSCHVRSLTGKCGHALACVHEGVCDSVLRQFRMLAVHHPCMREYVRIIYSVKSPNVLLQRLFMACNNGTRMELDDICDSIQATYFHSREEDEPQNNIEYATHVSDISEKGLFQQFQKHFCKFEMLKMERAEHVCVSCQQMFYRKQVRVKKFCALEDSSIAWARLVAYIIVSSDGVPDNVIVCRYCHNKLQRGQTPTRSVLNDMLPDPIPDVLQTLNMFESILVQRVKPFQAIVRLQPKTSHAPRKELVRAAHGRVVYLPLNTSENAQTINLARAQFAPIVILVNGVPTKKKEVWQSLVDLTKVHAALVFLKEHNPLYADVEIERQYTAMEDLTEGVQETKNIERVQDQHQAHIYEQYTVRPLHDGVLPGDNVELYQMNAVRGDPVSVWDTTLEARCFPLLFPFGKGTRLQARDMPVMGGEYRNSRLRSVNGRFRRNCEYIFHLLHECNLSALAFGVAHALNTTSDFKNISARELLAKVQGNDTKLEGSLHNIFANMRGTREYWYRRQSELNCMLRHYGSPTWFLTLSCAEYAWPELADYLRRVNTDVPNFDQKTPGEMCALDPETVSKHYHHRFHAILEFILNKENPPLGLVQHHFWRVEYQARGAPHVHMLLWVENAPKFELSTPEEIVQFLDKYITCALPSVKSNPVLRHHVLRFQQHKCGKYCYRRFSGGGKTYTRCRFGFPRRTRKETQVNDLFSSIRHHVKHRSSKRAYELVRSKSSIRINDYCAALLYLWAANIDVQFVADNYTALARYITSYITKHEKTELKEMWKEISTDKPISARLFALGVKALNLRECGAYEATDHLSGRNLYGKSVTIEWLSLGDKQSRRRVLKTFADIELLADIAPDTINIFRDNLIDTYYPGRHAMLDDVCLMEIAENFTFNKKGKHKPESGSYGNRNVEGAFVRKRKPSITNHRAISNVAGIKREAFYLVLLQLFVPWREEDQLLAGYTNSETAFEAQKGCITYSKYNLYIAMLTKEHEDSEEVATRLLDDTLECDEDKALESPSALVLGYDGHDAHVAMEEVHAAMLVLQDCKHHINAHAIDLNHEQLEIFKIIQGALSHTMEHANALCECDHVEQLLMFISGEAGTGKSHLISVVTTYVQELYGDCLACVVTAPTGLAAFSIGGVTLHRLLMLPVEHDGKLQYRKLNSNSANEVAQTLRKVRLLIVDEVSMVSNLMFAFMHLRLQEILRTNDDVLFGGIHILVLGDLLQLTPVKGQPAFRTLSTVDCRASLGAIGNVNLWRNFTYRELCQNMRQAQDTQYANILKGIRVGHISKVDTALLSARCVVQSTLGWGAIVKLYQDLVAAGEHPMCLLPTTAACDELNRLIMSIEGETVVTVRSIDRLDTQSVDARQMELINARLHKLQGAATHTAGLEKELYLCINCKVMLRRNIDVDIGLVNGAMGRILNFVFKANLTEVDYINVRFDNIPTVKQIARSRVRFQLYKDMYIVREQFPLSPAYAVTIHKSQGLSLKTAIVDVGSSVFQEGMAYVALSRVRTLQGVHLVSFEKDKIRADNACISEYNRLRATYMPHLPRIDHCPGKIERVKKHTCPPLSPKCKHVTKKSKKEVEMPTHVIGQPSSIPLIEAWSLRFDNPNGVNCYANAIMQMLHNTPEFSMQVHAHGQGRVSNAVKTLYTVQSGCTDRCLTTTDLRKEVDVARGTVFFQLIQQQDASEFFMALVNTLDTEGCDVVDLFKVDGTWEQRCLQPGHSTFRNFRNELWIQLHFPNAEKVDMSELINPSYIDDICITCGSALTVHLHITYHSRYLLILLSRFNPGYDKNTTGITGYRSGHINIDGRAFKTVAVIFHKGPSIHTGHYITWARQGNTWFVCNDEHISSMRRLPKLMKDAYILCLTPV